MINDLNENSDWDVIHRCLRAVADGPNGVWDAERWCVLAQSLPVPMG